MPRAGDPIGESRLGVVEIRKAVVEATEVAADAIPPQGVERDQDANQGLVSVIALVEPPAQAAHPLDVGDGGPLALGRPLEHRTPPTLRRRRGRPSDPIR